MVNVDSLSCLEPATQAPLPVAEGIRLLPSMGNELVPALLSLVELKFLAMDIGEGSVSQQLSALHKLYT